MIEWIRSTAGNVGRAVKSTVVSVSNTPAPIGKTVATVLIIEGVVVVVFLATHKVKFITVLG